MGWVKLDDQFWLRPRCRAIGKDGRELFLSSLAWCSASLTDGVIPKSSLPVIAALAEVEPSVADLLIAEGLWEDQGDSYLAVDYLKFNPSRSKVEADREAARNRAKGSRELPPKEPRTSPASSSSPSDVLKSSSSLTLVGTDDGLPDGFWPMFAQRKLACQAPGSVKSPGPWTKRTAENGALEQGPRARELYATFDVSPSQLADALIAGVVPPSWSTQRRATA